MNRQQRAMILSFAGVVCLAIAAVNSRLRMLALPAALICLFLASTSLSRAARISSSLPPLSNQLVSIQVWGRTLPGAAFRIASIRSFGAGLLLDLYPAAGGPRQLLKVAQPNGAHVRSNQLEVREAAYVSWVGTKLTRNPDQPALLLSWPAA